MSNKQTEKSVELLRTFIKQRRSLLGLSQQALAETAEVSIGLIGMVESGKRGAPRKETMIKLSRALRYSEESAGEVMNLMSLILSGVVPAGVVTEVSKGKVRAANALMKLTQVSPEDHEGFVPTPDKFDRLAQALDLLRVDLDPGDMEAIAHLLNRLYRATD